MPLYKLYSELLLFYQSHISWLIPRNTPSSNARSSRTVWHDVAVQHQQLCDDERYWYRSTGYVLALLLQKATYSEFAQRRILKFFLEGIVPNLGLARDKDGQTWNSFMTDDGHPMELSWDWHTGKQKPSIRFSIEPISTLAGTSRDPFNEFGPSNFPLHLKRLLPETNLEWLNYFGQHFDQRNTSRHPVEGHTSLFFFAFDLEEDQITSKAYIFPGYLAKATKQSSLETIFQALQTAPYCTSAILKDFRLFEEHANSIQVSLSEIEVFAMDLIKPSKSRLKVYFRDRRTTFASVEQTMRLGTQSYNPAEIEHGMQNLRRLWYTLLKGKVFSDDASLLDLDHRTAGILYNVEFRLDSSHPPKVKVYIPVRHYATSDWDVIVGLNDYFRRTNDPADRQAMSYGSNYSKALSFIFSEQSLQQSTGVHTYIACSIENEGSLRVVSYLNPQPSKFSKEMMQLSNSIG